MTDTPKTPVGALLQRAHSPNSTSRIYHEKIKYRPFLLRPSSPPPAALHAREARRKSRQAAKQKKKLKPKPLSARERRRLGLYEVPKEGRKYALFGPLHKLWLGYMREILGSDIYRGGFDCGQKLVGAEFTGAEMEVVRSGCVSRVGVRGIVIKDSRHVFEVITKKNQVKVIPKEGTIFRVAIPVEDQPVEGEARDGAKGKSELIPRDGTDTQTQDAGGVAKAELKDTKEFVFEVHGDQFLYRAADRSNRKWKAHFSKAL